ncbi:uncharacterized protein J8A68_001944 [[Candida] subhashii]|uniref:Uncharacterized protein n=1 Tax=[Candida] subhashii TaxID=561895 RepID=A0A8J5UJE8_9ASCO|nr:uncharacterized protein J8A68_001944 [[Candida] subhashii]KAG7664518.1 hypothetical protein J8A68_001944 [[Candida] subhashii]
MILKSTNVINNFYLKLVVQVDCILGMFHTLIRMECNLAKDSTGSGDMKNSDNTKNARFITCIDNHTDEKVKHTDLKENPINQLNWSMY